MRLLKQAASANVMVFMTDSTDHITGKASLTLTITSSQDGGAFGSITPTVTERGSGWYSLALTTSHTNTLGDLAIHITGSGADPSDLVCRVVAVDFADAVRYGLTALPNAAAAASGGVPTIGAAIPNATAGQAGGLFIAGTNAATTITTGLTTTFTGNLTGSVNSVTTGVPLAASQHVIVDSGTVTTLTNLPAIPANWITATGITAAALNGKGDWNTTTPPTAAAIAAVILTTPANPLATDSSGRVILQPTQTGVTIPTVTTCTNLTNAATAGDLTATMKTSVTTAATAATPTAAAVTGAVGSVTGAVGSVTGAVVLPSIPANWITATGITAAALNGKGDWNTTTPPTSATIAGAVWDVTLSGHLTAGTTGFALNAAGSAGDPWGTALPGAYGAGSAGYIIGHNIDAAVSTRSTYAGGAVASVTGAVGSVTGAVVLPTIPANWITATGINAAALNGKGDWSTYAGGDTSGTTTLLTRLTSTRAGLLDNLDAAISTRSVYAGGAVASVTGAVGSVTGAVGSVTAAVVLPSIPTNWITAAGINASALNGKGDWNTTTPPTSATIAGAVWDVTLVSHLTAGTTGFALNAAGSAGDPWGTALPGAYSAGSAGYIVGHNIDAAVSTRSTYAGGAVASVTGAVTLAASQHVIVDSGTVTTLTNLPSLPANWLTGTGTDATAVTKIQSGLATPTNITAASGVALAASQHVIVDSGTVTTLTNLPSVTTDWLTAAGVKADAVTKIQTGLATPTNITAASGVALAANQHVIVDSGTVTTLTNLPSIPANWITAAGVNAAALNGKGDWLASSGYSAPPSASTIAGSVVDQTISGHTTAGTVGGALQAAGSAGDPWSTTLPGAYGVGTAGKLIGTYLDAAVSTRSTYAGGAVASVTGAVGSVTGAVGSVTSAVTLAASQHVIVDSGTVTTLTNLPAIPPNWITSTGITAAALTGKGDWNTTTPPSSATIAGAVWDVTLASHLTGGTAGFALNAAGSAGDPWGTALPGAYVAGSAGYIIGHNIDAAISTRSTYAGGAVASVTGAVGSVTGAVTLPSIPANWITAAGINASALNGKGDWNTTTPPTAAAVATAVWTDTTVGDFTTTSSPGKIIATQLGSAFTTTSSSVFSTASLVNAPSGTGASAATIATAVWQDLLASSDFSMSSSVGALLKTAIPNAAAGATGGLFIAGTNAATTVTTAFTSTFTGNLTGSVGSVTGAVGSVTSAVTLDKTQVLSAARALDSIADTSLTINDALHCAVAWATGKQTVVGTAYTIKTPSTGTVLRTFTLDSSAAPTSRT